MTESRRKTLADLIDMDRPGAVLDEALFILTIIAPRMNPSLVSNAFDLTVGLYRGDWPGERACNTGFHDLHHITDTFLATTRLVHGAIIDGQRFSDRQILMVLVAALAHDTGYIQNESDRKGTGAKYTRVHVPRSVDFVLRYGRRYGLTPAEVPHCQAMIQATDLATEIEAVPFAGETYRRLAKILATADLIAQMADRTYLEKLLYLFEEFKEGQIDDYETEIDLLNNTLEFFQTMTVRLKDQLGGMDRLAERHFRSRWGIRKNLYHDAMNSQQDYLRKVLAQPDPDLAASLRRRQIARRLKARHRQSTDC